MKYKKGAEGTIWMVVIIVILLLFLAIYTGVFTKLFGKGASGINDQFGSAGDPDNDNVINLVDKCPCQSGEQDNEGCPSGHKILGNGQGYEGRDCLKKT